MPRSSASVKPVVPNQSAISKTEASARSLRSKTSSVMKSSLST
ncbi:Hypothetical protein F387_00651 [Wohlfahrtiimonas chitiniclastica SH04]|uniref:Uncharacterized protein n=1 Tax=Wohlfahrtiimonas chitiniclastica SH04 TaxID=1261130 RepID=L8XVJ5_9GAMM|nr:Hypothetical protein F387_00651 [Wohlfahrtiimonas chitiniclastica SH04]